MNHSHLLDLEKEARRNGTGLIANDLLGCWYLDGVWSKGETKANPINTWILRSLDACLEITMDRTDELRLRNALAMGFLSLQFTGTGQLRGRQPLLMFRFEQMEITLGNFSLLKRKIPSPKSGREPFFALISRSSEGWLAARGRGGGLALWKLEGC